MTIIQVYAPTDDAENEDKHDLYHQLQATLQKIKRRDIKIVIGDFNAIPKTQERRRHGERHVTSNKNGKGLIEMCQANGLSIGGTWFPHKECQKVTWISPNGLTENQIDHFLVGKRWRSSLQDVRARRSADIGSDHHLVVGVMKLKLASAPRRKSGE